MERFEFVIVLLRAISIEHWMESSIINEKVHESIVRVTFIRFPQRMLAELFHLKIMPSACLSAFVETITKAFCHSVYQI